MTQPELAEVYTKASYLPIGRRRWQGVKCLGVLHPDTEIGQLLGIRERIYIYEDILSQWREEHKTRENEDYVFPRYMRAGESLVKLDIELQAAEEKKKGTL